MSNVERINNLLHIEFKIDSYPEFWEFVILWNLFESRLFDNSFSINKAIYKNYTADSHVQDEVLKYYQGRYVTDNKVNQKFNDLGIRDKDKKENVARILCKQQDSELTEPTAIMSIIYRLRNKLFHGLKGVESFSGNKQLYEYANKFLLSCLECNKNV